MKSEIEVTPPFIYSKTVVSAVFILIAIITVYLRVNDLDKNPAGFFPDEASTAYDAWCLLQHGYDQHGVRWPFFFISFADDLCGTYRYMVLITQFFIGKSVFSTRLPMALTGIATCLLVFLGIRRIYGIKAALFAFLIISTSPWHLPYCRTGQRIMLLPFGISLWLFFRSYLPKNFSKTTYYLSWICLGLSLYTYVSARIVIPALGLTLAGLDLYYFKHSKKVISLALFFFILTFIPIVYHAMDQPELFSLRYRQVSIFNQGNSFADTLLQVMKNYLSHFSFSFLFLKGDLNLRHSQYSIGQMLFSQLPLIILGLIFFLRKKGAFEAAIILLILIAPLPAALSIEGNPHALRSVAALIPFTYLTAFGFKSLSDSTWKTRLPSILKTIIVICTLLESTWIGFDLMVRYPIYSARAWEFGTREAINAAISISSKYDEIWFDRETIGADRIIAFECDIDCSDFALYGLSRTKFRWNWRASIDEIIAFNDSKKKLLIARPESVISGKSVLQPILRPDGSVAFIFIEQ